MTPMRILSQKWKIVEKKLFNVNFFNEKVAFFVGNNLVEETKNSKKHVLTVSLQKPEIFFRCVLLKLCW